MMQKCMLTIKSNFNRRWLILDIFLWQYDNPVLKTYEKTTQFPLLTSTCFWKCVWKCTQNTNTIYFTYTVYFLNSFLNNMFIISLYRRSLEAKLLKSISFNRPTAIFITVRRNSQLLSYLITDRFLTAHNEAKVRLARWK